MNTFGFLRTEALSLLIRLRQLSPFSLVMPMSPAATISAEAMEAIDRHLEKAKSELRKSVTQFIRWLDNASRQNTAPSEAQERFTFLKIRFNQILDQLDIFADVLSQRSEHFTGVWVAGLDALAEDALRLPAKLYEAPPVICFLDRGHGAAIRKARTRLPGGDSNPVAVIQVPRERMVGSGIGASLIHEAGHQGAALLSLVESVRPELKKARQRDPAHDKAWDMYDRWISEILADVWSLGHLGIGATVGLMGVVSLPRYFVFRMLGDDPHPFPWIRVMLSLSFGRLLFPDPQWTGLEKTWCSMYPTKGLPSESGNLIRELNETMPAFVRLVAEHKSKRTDARRLADILPYRKRQPARLAALFKQWQIRPDDWLSQAPSLVFAVVGQARFSGLLSPEAENQLLVRCLTHWAKRQRAPLRKSDPGHVRT
ncbi:MAG: hypothetical protein KDC70_03455 [Saprospiraceae bacterium]|nr:hypothetical protein [Saprospiraceae bacterium]